jgi:hypothetical protein
MLSLQQAVTQNEALRRVAIPVYRVYARVVVFNPGPRVLVNSMPKAGTHLVTSLLKNLPRMMFAGRHHGLRQFELADPQSLEGKPGDVDWARLERALGSVNRGQFLTGHFSAEERLLSILDKLGYKTLSIIRDPRDVAVSSAFYYSRLKRHFLYERFNSEFKTMEDRLLAVIKGLPSTRASPGLVPISGRINEYLRWLDAPHTYTCRFERLVGPSGGGSGAEQHDEIAAVARHVERPLTDEQIDTVAKKTWSSQVSTFRKGSIGDWRNHFTERHVAAFKEVAGSQLVELGYEDDLSWGDDGTWEPLRNVGES